MASGCVEEYLSNIGVLLGGFIKFVQEFLVAFDPIQLIIRGTV
jgi:hypothetical protein